MLKLFQNFGPAAFEIIAFDKFAPFLPEKLQFVKLNLAVKF